MAQSASSSPSGAAGRLGAKDSQPELLPARMLNEFCYCPRLGYLMWAEGEWAPSLDTKQGLFAHRRVDKGDRKSVPAGDGANSSKKKDEKEELHARSVSLSAPGEGLIAKLDLLELDGNRATPVDYKRGKAPNLPEGAYEPERVQLCAQGLILRENGYDCDEGVIYYVASKKRVVIPFDDALVERTRQLAVDFRATATGGAIPPPLVDSPKCPRCSLVGICLPDEINALSPPDEPSNANGAAANGAAKKKPLKLLPALENALPIYVQQQGAMVGKSGDRLTVKLKGEKLTDTKLIDVSQLCLFGNAMVTAPAISELMRRGTPICHFSYGGWFNAMTTGLAHKNIDLRIKQFATAADAEASLAIARLIVTGKIRNCRTIVMRHLSGRDHPAAVAMDDYRRKAGEANSADSLLGLEGMAAKTYFAEFFSLLPQWSRGDVDSRNRRPPTDPANAVLSFLYALLTKELHVALQGVGFDPMLGVYHRPRYGRPSLALDLAEEFRPLVADSTVLTLFNNGEVGEQDFIARAGAVALTDAGRRAVIAAFERRLATEVTHPLFGYSVAYRRIMEVQCRLLARTLSGEIESYPAFVTR